MKVFSYKLRKDGKYSVKIGFNSGKRMTKIVDQDTLKAWVHESMELTPDETRCWHWGEIPGGVR